MGSIIIVLICIIILGGIIYNIYTSVIKAKNKVQEAFASIDVQLKKRYDLIPNVLTVASKFMEHERTLLENLTNLRTQAVKLPSNLENSARKFELENQINQCLKNLRIAVENYPQLKSDQTMINAMNTFQDVEEHIAAARRFYNSAALELNNLVEIFPSSVVANAMNIQKVEFFQSEEKERRPISAEDFLK